MAIYYLWLAIKYRGAMLPTAANPGIFSGGIVGESKLATLRDLMAGSPDFTLGETVSDSQEQSSTNRESISLKVQGFA